MFRRSSREKPPGVSGPTYMSREQMGNFLQDLRSNRPQRPMGTRPLPWLRAAASKTELDLQTSKASDAPTTLERAELPPRSTSSLSTRHDSSQQHNEKRDSRIGRPLVRQPSDKCTLRQPSREPKQAIEGEQVNIPYVENGQRWMERQESQSISMALRDMDLREDQKLHSAAQDEASELVWKHQNPNAPYRNPDAAKYKSHLRKGSHARAHSIEKPRTLQHSQSQDRQTSSAGSDEATSSGQSSNQSTRVPSDSSLKTSPSAEDCEKNDSSSKQEPTIKIGSLSKKSYRGLAESVAKDILTHRRTSSGSKRKASGQIAKSIFKNPDDEIYEEPEEIQNAKIEDPRPPPMPLSMRRNPFARVKFAQQEKHERSNSEPILTTKFHKYDIHKNPPSQSRNPGYTSNVSTPPRTATPDNTGHEGNEDSPRVKDGKEVRGDDIKAATSMRIKDRSSKLPTPSVVSDKPGRPIVSFDPNWKPKEIEMNEEISKDTPRSSNDSRTETKPERPMPMARKAATATGVPTLDVLDIASRERAHSPPPAIHNDTMETSIVVPVINVDGPPQVPSIQEPGPSANPSFSHSQAPLMRSNTTPVPIINAPDDPEPNRHQTVPTINISDEAVVRPTERSVPSINLPSRPLPSSRQHPLPAINTPENSNARSSPRQLPTINLPDASRSPTSSRPLPTISAPSSHHSHPKPSGRPLPTPTPSAPRPNPLRHAHTTSAIQPAPSSTPHWSPSVHRDQALCAHCALPIAGRIVSAASHRFHPTCFTCHHCGEGLECVAFYPEPAGARAERLQSSAGAMDEGPRFYCHLDFHEFFSPRCKSCHTPIEGEVVVACGAEWHVGHFFCAQCGDPFERDTPFVEKDGYAWCVGCHANRYSAKCRKCRKPVTEVVVKALGKEWHQECFVCMECGGEFADGRYFLRGESQDPVCVKCEARRLKA